MSSLNKAIAYFSKQTVIASKNKKPNAKQVANWNKLYRKQQEQYLKDHPKSIYKNLEVKKPADGSSSKKNSIPRRKMSTNEKTVAKENLAILEKGTPLLRILNIEKMLLK